MSSGSSNAYAVFSIFQLLLFNRIRAVEEIIGGMLGNRRYEDYCYLFRNAQYMNNIAASGPNP